MDLLGKVVKTDNYHFIGSLYPNFPFVSHLCFNKADIPGIIYTGGAHLVKEENTIITEFHTKEDLNKTGIPFISTYSADGKYDFDLTLTGKNAIDGRTTILDLVYSRKKLNYLSLDIDMLEVLLHMDEQDFYDFAKYCWYFKEQCIKPEDLGFYSSKAIPKLLNKSTEEIYSEILSIESDTALDTLELSLSNFIMNSKVKNYDPNGRDVYNTVMRTFDNNTNGNENEIAVIFSKYRYMSHTKKIKLIWLFTELKKRI